MLVLSVVFLLIAAVAAICALAGIAGPATTALYLVLVLSLGMAAMGFVLGWKGSLRRPAGPHEVAQAKMNRRMSQTNRNAD